jgi:hypothetical protein
MWIYIVVAVVLTFVFRAFANKYATNDAHAPPEQCHARFLPLLPGHLRDSYRMADAILPGLFLGNECAARDPELMEKEKIGAIIAMSFEHGFQLEHHPVASRLTFHSFGLWDNNYGGETFIRDTLTQAADAIAGHIAAGRRVLVHCQVGKSRSSAAVIAYLLKYHSERFDTYPKARAFVAQARPIIQPNTYFESVLEKHFASDSREKEML